MPTHVVLSIPVGDLRLGETIDQLSDVYCYVEQTAMGNTEDLLHLWISCRDTANIPAALDADSSVYEYIRLTGGKGRQLYKIQLKPGIHFPRRIIHRHSGTIREAYGDADAWTFDVRFPDREDLAATGELFDRYDVDVTYESISGTATPSEEQRNSLSDAQREAVEVALDLGFYDVPRRASLEDVATELGITHQALSERFRRATQHMATDYLDGSDRRSVGPMVK